MKDCIIYLNAVFDKIRIVDERPENGTVKVTVAGRSASYIVESSASKICHPLLFDEDLLSEFS